MQVAKQFSDMRLQHIFHVFIALHKFQKSYYFDFNEQRHGEPRRVVR
jgi:hypothetical protein